MTEGECYEMREREAGYKARYDNLDNDALNDEYDTLEDRLSKNSLDGGMQEEMRYINTLWGKADSREVIRQRRARGESSTNMVETDFGGGTVTADGMRHEQAVSMVGRFMKERLNVDMSSRLTRVLPHLT